MAENAAAMVRAGINAYKAGNKDEARNLLLKAVEADPYSEDGWLWLSGLLESPDDQRTALENVLAINPTNDRARKGLDFLLSKSAPPPAADPPPAAPARGADISTSVEWATPEDAARSAAQSFTPSNDPTHDVDYDQWVTDLNLPPQGPRPAVNIPAGGSLFIATEDDTTFDDSTTFDDTTFTDGPFNAAIFEDDESSDSPVRTSATPSPTPAFDMDDDDDYLPADAAAAIAAAGAPLPKASPFAGVDLDAAEDFEVRESGIRPAKQVDKRDRSAERQAKSAAKAAAKAERQAQKAAAKTSKTEIPEEDRLEMDEDTRAIVESLAIIPREIEPTRVPGTHERQPILLVAAVVLLVLLNIGAAVLLLNRILVPVSL